MGTKEDFEIRLINMAINIFLDWGLEDEQSARDQPHMLYFAGILRRTVDWNLTLVIVTK